MAWDLGFGIWDLGFVVSFSKQLAGWPHATLDLPESASALVGERIQRADVGERRQLVAPQPRPLHDLLDRCEAPDRAQLHGPLVRARVAEVGPELARVA